MPVRTFPTASRCGMGDSRGRWEGSTLVVDVANNNDLTWFDVVGSLHSDALRVSERFVPINADTIDYTAVLTDPRVYTRPWTMKLTFQRDHGLRVGAGRRGVLRVERAQRSSSC